MTPYEKEFTFTVGANGIVALDYPGRCIIDAISIVHVGTGAIACTPYNRAFTTGTVGIASITNDGNTKTKITLVAPSQLLVKVGDVIVVASSATSGYNTSHRVTAIIGDYAAVVTDQSYTADDFSRAGTAALAIPSGEQPLYAVCAAISGTDNVLSAGPYMFVNLDPRPNANIGINRKIYLKLTAAATYKVAIRSHESIGGGTL